MELSKLDRRSYQQQLQRRRRRQRKRRQARLRRIHTIRMLRSARFWLRFGITALIFLFVVFWAKFAYVYDVPSYAKRGPLTNISVYITAKPWWFGPPVFDLERYAPDPADDSYQDPYTTLLQNLGRYDDVLVRPSFVWLARNP